jgi:hypothetical protein
VVPYNNIVQSTTWGVVLMIGYLGYISCHAPEALNHVPFLCKIAALCELVSPHVAMLSAFLDDGKRKIFGSTL